MDHQAKESRETGPPEGRYANYFKVGHNAVEFLLDFGQFYPESDEKQLHTRIITSPIYAKALLEIIRKSLDQYEQIFGAIPQGEGTQYGGSSVEKGGDGDEMKNAGQASEALYGRWNLSKKGTG